MDFFWGMSHEIVGGHERELLGQDVHVHKQVHKQLVELVVRESEVGDYLVDWWPCDFCTHALSSCVWRDGLLPPSHPPKEHKG